MGFVARSAAALAAMLAVAVGGCGGEPYSPPPETWLWRAGPWPGPHPAAPAFDLEHHVLVALDLPWAGDAGRDRWPTRNEKILRYVVNLIRHKDLGPCIYFRGLMRPLREERERAYEDLGRELTALSHNPLFRERPEYEFEIVLRCDYFTSWRELHDTLAVVEAPTVRFRRVTFAVASPASRVAPGAAIHADPSSPDSAEALPISWSVATGPIVRIGARDWSFPAGDPYKAGANLDTANANWTEIRAALHEEHARGSRAVTMSVAAEVPWAHVAQTMGLLLDADLTDLRIEGLAPRRLSTPARRPEWKGAGSGEVEAHDLPRALLFGIGAGLACALYGLMLLGRRPRRPRRPRAPH